MRLISHDDDALGSTGCGTPPSAATSRIERWASGPLTYATLRPDGCQVGSFPSAARRRASPPNTGTTQMSPPYVRASSVPDRWPIFTIRVRDERVDTKAIDRPSGENDGWKFSESLFVTLTSWPPSTRRR